MKDEKTTQEEVNLLVERARSALRAFHALDQNQVDAITEAAAAAAYDQRSVLAMSAVEETGRGAFEDKTIKNIFASATVAAQMRPLKTVGEISHDPLTGIREIAEPVGVVAALTPVTNPTSTTIFKALMCLKTRNPVIFAFHPHAQKCSAASASIVYEAARAAGAPEGVIQWIEEPSLAATSALIQHEGTDVILATGGNAMVRAAYSCGKPALGVGAGNVPAYIHASARVDQAVHDIVCSKAFDNGMICASEQAVILDAQIEAQALEAFAKLGAYRVTSKEKNLLEKLIFGVGKPADRDQAKLNAAVVGKRPQEIAKMAGFEVPESTSVILVDAKEVGPSEPLTREKLCPVLTVLHAASTEEGIQLSTQMVELDGLGHTAAIHAYDEQVIRDFSQEVRVIRVVENSPASQGAIGGIYNDFIPSLTLGCGSYGRNSVSNNVSAINLINIKRTGRRNTVDKAFQIPPSIIHGWGTLRQLATIPKVRRATIITTKETLSSGVVDTALQLLHGREEPVSVQVIDEVTRKVTPQMLRPLIQAVAGFAPDTFIALGTTAAANTAKVLRAIYEYPGTDVDDLCCGRVVMPRAGDRTQLVCVPTTSGGQASLSPAAWVEDPNLGSERLVEGEAFLPHVVIMDPELAATWDAQTVAARGFETLAQAVEAYLSLHASDLTDALNLHAIKLGFENLQEAVSGEESISTTRCRSAILSAGTLAAIGVGNSATGLAYSMSQALSEVFEVPRQQALAVLLPTVVRFNGSMPTKLVPWPNYSTYVVPERCDNLCAHLGLAITKTGSSLKAGAGAGSAGVERFATGLEKLRAAVGLGASLSEIGISKKALGAQLDALVMRAFDYQSVSGNPRTAKLEEIRALFTSVG